MIYDKNQLNGRYHDSVYFIRRSYHAKQHTPFPYPHPHSPPPSRRFKLTKFTEKIYRKRLCNENKRIILQILLPCDFFFNFFHLDPRYSIEYAHTCKYVRNTDTCKTYTCNTYFIGWLLSVYIFAGNDPGFAKLKSILTKM